MSIKILTPLDYLGRENIPYEITAETHKKVYEFIKTNGFFIKVHDADTNVECMICSVWTFVYAKMSVDDI